MHKFNIKNIEKLDNPERRKMMPPDETIMKFNIKDNGNFLDVGCGIGYFTIPAAKLLKDNKVFGIDILDEMINEAEKRADGIDNIEFRKSEEYSFPIEDGSVKYVFISNVIHEVEDKTRYFNEINRVLQQGGFALIIDWDKKETKMGPPLHERISKEEMIDIAKTSGFIALESMDITENHYGIKLEKH